MAVVESILQKVLDSLRNSLQGQFDSLNARVSELEAKLNYIIDHNSHPSCSGNNSRDKDLLPNQNDPNNLIDIEQKLALISSSLQAQQQVLEMKEREDRALNIVILGIE